MTGDELAAGPTPPITVVAVDPEEEEGEDDRMDFSEFIMEAAVKAIYGDEVFNWVNEQYE